MEWWHWILLPIVGFATVIGVFLLLAFTMNLIKKWMGDNRTGNDRNMEDNAFYMVIAMIILTAIIWWLTV